MKRTLLCRDERGTGGQLGDNYRALLQAAYKNMKATDDNSTWVCFGDTGSGKSTLGLQSVEEIQDGGVKVELIGTDHRTFAQALGAAREGIGDCLIYDEGAIVKREAMTKKNRDFINLLSKFRSRNWFLWINYPDADYLDKTLVTGNYVNFFIYVYAKQKRFYVFTRKRLKDYLKEFGRIDLDDLKKYGKQYAFLDSWFLKYKNEEVWKEYQELKEDSTDGMVDDFIEEWGGEPTYTTGTVAKMLGCHYNTVFRHLTELIESKVIVKEEVQNKAGHYRLGKEHIELIENRLGGVDSNDSNYIITREEIPLP